MFEQSKLRSAFVIEAIESVPFSCQKEPCKDRDLGVSPDIHNISTRAFSSCLMLTPCFTASVRGLPSTAQFSFYAYLTKKQKVL